MAIYLNCKINLKFFHTGNMFYLCLFFIILKQILWFVVIK